jgi:O-antigen/teichoic acid export membrane protein
MPFGIDRHLFMSLIRKALIVNTSAFICLFMGMLQNVVFSRVLGPAGIGQYAVINSAMMLGAQLFCLGFPMAFLYYSQHDPSNTTKYLMNSIYATLIVGLFGGCVLVMLIVEIPDYFGAVGLPALFLICIYIPLVLERVISRNYLLIEIQALRIGKKGILAMLGSLLLTLIFYLHGSLTVSNAIICFITAAFIRWLIGWVWMKEALAVSSKFEWSTTYKLGKMGVRQSWADLMVLLNAQISIIVVRYAITDFESVGYFSRGLRIAMLAVTAGQAIMPLLFSRWATISEPNLSKHVEKVIRFFAATSAAMVVVIITTGKWIILILYGPEFLPAVRPMIILVPGAVFYLLSSSLMQLLGARGNPEYSAVLLGIATVVNAFLAMWLIPVWDIIGASIASTISNIMLMVGLLSVVVMKYNVNISRCLIINSNDIRSIKNAFLRDTREC